jgi:hypothetical protein
MNLNITVKGSGNVICGFEINGKACKEPFVSCRLSGVQNIAIRLGAPPSTQD